MFHPRSQGALRHELGWLVRFPRILFATWAMKRKHRALGTEGYLDHQRAFFGMSALRQTNDKFARVRQVVARYARAGGHSSVLDVATGYGFQAGALRDGGFARVVAVDIAPERVDCGRQLFPEGIEFRVMDATRLEFGNATFDAATVSAALHDMPPTVKRKAIAEIARVARHTVVLLEPRTFRNPVLAFLYGTLGSCVDESLHFLDYVRDDLDTLLAEHGLDVVQRETAWFGLLSITVCHRAAGAPVVAKPA
jgi:SAM-dependent methyltransferase